MKRQNRKWKQPANNQRLTPLSANIVGYQKV